MQIVTNDNNDNKNNNDIDSVDINLNNQCFIDNLKIMKHKKSELLVKKVMREQEIKEATPFYTQWILEEDTRCKKTVDVNGIHYHLFGVEISLLTALQYNIIGDTNYDTLVCSYLNIP